MGTKKVQSFENNWCGGEKAKNKQLVSHSRANDSEQTISRVCGGNWPHREGAGEKLYVKENVSSLQK